MSYFEGEDVTDNDGSYEDDEEDSNNDFPYHAISDR